jgi:hypothetical protein
MYFFLWPRHRWKVNMRIYLKGIGISTRDWVDSAQYRDYWRVFVNEALNLRVPYAMELVSYAFILYVRLINCRFYLFRSFSSSFSFQYILFLKSSKSCVILLLTPLTSVFSSSLALWRRQFILRIWSSQLTFLRRILFRSGHFFPIRLKPCSWVTISDHFIFSILLEHKFI